MNSLARFSTTRYRAGRFVAALLLAGATVAAAFPFVIDEPGRGVFLVANKSMRDPNFAKTVVLITDHGILGSVGLVVNRASDVPVVTSIPELDGLESANITLRYGGPVGLNSIRLLVASDEAIDSAHQLIDGVYFVNTSSLLRSLLGSRGRSKDVTIQYYAGFAAWSPGQLQGEIDRGDWHLVRADATTIFNDDGATLWQQLIEKLEGMWVLRENGDPRFWLWAGSSVNAVTNPRRPGGRAASAAYNRGEKPKRRA